MQKPNPSEQEKVELLSRITGRTESDLRFLIGLDDYSHIKTVAEAKAIHNNSDPNFIGSEAQKMALRRWLFLIETLEEVLDVWHTVSHSEHAKKLVLKKWLTLVKTAWDAKEFCNKAYGSSFENFSIKNLNRLALAEAKAANTLKEVQEAFMVSPSGSLAEQIAFDKWLIFIDDCDKAMECYKITAARNNSFGEQIIAKWISFVKTPEIASIAYKTVPEELKNIFLKRWDELSLIEAKTIKNPRDAKAAWIMAPTDGIAISVINSVWDKLIIARLNKATTACKVKNVFNLARNNSEPKNLALLKLIPLINDVDKIMAIYYSDISKEGNSINSTALNRWDDLIMEKINKAKTITQVLIALNQVCKFGRAYRPVLTKLFLML